MSFTLEQFKQNIKTFSDTPCIWVAYSGGCDSHVLLHALASLNSKINLKAIHINHGLSPLANAWEDHCRKICMELSIPYLSISVDVIPEKTSPEEAARLARYSAWNNLVAKDEILLLAHHQDDQAETILIQLLRGAGVKGLAGMPAIQNFAEGYLCRPLLTYSREELHAYAIDNNLNWIDDPSNFDTDFDRNFLRHDVLPLLETHWPALKKTLSRSAMHQAEADKLLTVLAEKDWFSVSANNQIEIISLIKLDEERQRNVVRYWLATICKLSLPDTVHLSRILNEVLTAAEDAVPEVIWRGGEVRRYQGLLYAQEKMIDPPDNIVLPWLDLEKPLELNNTDLKISATSSLEGKGLSEVKLKDAEITLRFRQGGETCRPAGRGQTHQLKKLFQEWQVPPWLRASIPLIYVDDELAQVVGYCCCEPYAAIKGEPGWFIE